MLSPFSVRSCQQFKVIGINQYSSNMNTICVSYEKKNLGTVTFPEIISD